MALPEDLRSELLTSYSRGELTNYHRNLLRAVEIWRRCGLWRAAPSRTAKGSGPVLHSSPHGLG